MTASSHNGTTSGAPRGTFHHALANTLVASTVNFTVWFAVTFFVYLETHSVFATGIIAGIFLGFTAVSGVWFGSLVDHHRKRTVMLASSTGSLLLYAASLAVHTAAGPAAFRDPASPVLWVFVLLLMGGVIVGNVRGIALSTVVTLLVPEGRRDRANGLVGTTSGVSFLVTSVISGLLIGMAGMTAVLLLAVVATGAVIVHLAGLTFPEERPAGTSGSGSRIDLRGTIALVASMPGLLGLIVFSTINNFLGGVFMALMDPYGLSLVSVEAWGLLWGVLSTGVIAGGLVISRRGLGSNPLRALLLANLVLWAICSVFALRSSIVLLAVGMFLYMCVMPYVEASEQTVLQKVVPFERQGRVFGFAQSVEQAASPLTAFLISPVAQFVFIPFMTTGVGAQVLGPWFGTGPERGLALLFTIAGVLGLVLTLAAFGTRHYRRLSRHYLGEPAVGPTTAVTREPALAAGV
ncbi:MFS transporter [Pseudonocardia kunmingensis]|uniref:DHA3 family multidrug efflux protein-like MFS transporter n=1 Tax=Pseudonocardia kunmingensis TaxID=630975 RepID=A0A543DRU1_9PSEU|nr:MFS transporter [Pseudonocardia kunmingensis]TQM12056.1 DHA3 family multidrug efflux protein-like MFS transporter [Pseudonocardia kunmingensis]